jgi:SAM-dependent methyltransferase
MAKKVKSIFSLDSKIYREIFVNGVEIKGFDSNKQRPTSYIFNDLKNNALLGKNVLDLGCAAGAVCFEALNRGAQSATGIEYDFKKFKSALRIASEFKIKNAFFKNENIIDFMIHNKKHFDTIFMLNILHHIHDPKLIMNLIIENEPEFLVFEGPIYPFFNSYKQFINHRRYFRLPWTARKVCRYLKQFGYAIQASESNNFTFIGGSRKLIIFKKTYQIRIPEIKQSSILRNANCVLIGASCSGKTHHTYRLNNLPSEFNAGLFKLDGLIRGYYANYLRDKRDKKIYKMRFKTRLKQYYYVNPVYGLKKSNKSIRGRRYSAKKWINLASKKSGLIIFLDVPRDIIIQRQVERASKRFLGRLNPKLVEKVLKIAIDHSISEDLAKFNISNLIEDKVLLKEIFKYIKFTFYPSVVFSKSDLTYKNATKDKLIYCLKTKS